MYMAIKSLVRQFISVRSIFTFVAGKNVSCGVIVLYCLNLPPEIRYLPENVYIVGLVPPPSSPNYMTISHILQPLVDVMKLYGTAGSVVNCLSGLLLLSLGKNLKTFSRPECTEVMGIIVPLIADLGAICKVCSTLYIVKTHLTDKI